MPWRAVQVAAWKHSCTHREGSMTDLERLGLAMIGFAVAIIVGGVLLGLIGAAIKRGRG